MNQMLPKGRRDQMGTLSRRDFLKLSGMATGSSVLAAMAGGCAPSLAPTASSRRLSSLPNIILIVVDAVRSDHVSSYGYARSTTPNLDSWMADQGVKFTHVSSTSSWTLPANAAMMTGRLPSVLNVNFENIVVPSNIPNLPEYLKAAGYYTAGFISAAYVQSNRGFARGFDWYDERASTLHPTTSASGLAGEVNGYAMTWLQTHWTSPTQPLFLFLYYFDPHTWYNPPAPYDVLYDNTYTGPLTPSVYRDGQDVVSGQIVPTPRDIEHLLALYDGEITYWDYHLGQMMAFLESRGLLDHAIVVVTSDHGDAFGEHGKWNHTNCLYEEILRVPMLMRYTGTITAGQTIDTPAQNMDLMPTLLDWLELPIPSGLEAASLRPLLEGSSLPQRDLFGEMEGVADPSHWAYWIAPRADLRSVRRSNWKYIHHVSDPASDELYDLQPDSIYETVNLIGNQPAIAQDLRDAIFSRFDIAPHQAFLPDVSR